MKKMANNKKINDAFEESKREAQEIKDFVMPSINKLKETADKIKEYYNKGEYKKMFQLITKDYTEDYKKAVEKYEFVDKKYGACVEYSYQIDDIRNDVSKFFGKVSEEIYESNNDNKYLILSLVKIGYDVPTLIQHNNFVKQEKERKQKKDEQEYKYEHAKNLMTVRMPAFIITFFVTLFVFSFIFKALPLLVFVWLIFLVDAFFFNLKYTKIIVERIKKMINKK